MEEINEPIPRSRGCKVINELFTGNHPEWITDRMFIRVDADLTAYVREVQKHGGWRHVATDQGNNTRDLIDIRNMVEAWQWRDRPRRTAWDAYVISKPQLQTNLPLNPRFDTGANTVLTSHILALNPPLLDPNTNEIMDMYRARNFFVWRYHVIVNQFHVDGMYDNYQSTHIPKVSTKFFAPLSLHRMPESTPKLSNWLGFYPGTGVALDVGWFFQKYKYFPCIGGYTSSELPTNPVWTSSQLASFKSAFQKLEGMVNPYYCSKSFPLYTCPTGECFIERTNHLLPNNPPFLGGPIRGYSEFAVMYGWLEQVALYSKGLVVYDLRSQFAWAYRDLPSRTVNDWFVNAWIASGGILNSTIINTQNLIDPLTGSRFTEPGWGQKFMDWRWRVGRGDVSETTYDNCVYEHINSPGEQITTRTFKPMLLHRQGKPMSWMPSSMGSGPQSAGYPENKLLYGWYFQKHKHFPNFMPYTIEQMPEGAREWTPAQLASWKSYVQPLIGEENPYYVEQALM